MRETRNAYKMLVGKLERKRIRRTRRACKDNIRMDVREMG
jgi:hypothetical protein